MNQLWVNNHKLSHVCIAVMLIITSTKLYFAALGPFDLFFDEAQYWAWSKELDWGYYSKPPVLAWAIALTTTLCGDVEWCVRLSSPLFHMATSLVIYAIAMELFDRKVACYSALIYTSMPAVTLSSFLVSTDAPLLFFWSSSLLFFVKALHSQKPVYWIMVGVTAGLGMLTKYNMLAFLFSVTLFIILIKQQRNIIRMKWFWIALAIAFIIFLPNIVWNWQNEFVSFLHTRDNANVSDITLYPAKLFEFLGSQLAVFGPIYFLVLLFCLFKAKKIVYKEPYGILLCFVIPLLLIILAISLLSRAHANWAAPIYSSATILVTAWLIKRNQQKWIHASLAINVLLLAGLLFFNPLVSALGITLSGKTTNLAMGYVKDPFKRVKGWKTLGKEVSAIWQSYPDATLLTNTRKIHAQLLYYVSPFPSSMVKWNPANDIQDHYELTTDINEVSPDRFLLVAQYQDRGNIERFFNSSSLLKVVTIPLYIDYKQRYYVYLLEGFKGYDYEP